MGRWTLAATAALSLLVAPLAAQTARPEAPVNPNAAACGCSSAGDAKPPAEAAVSLASIKRR